MRKVGRISGTQEEGEGEMSSWLAKVLFIHTFSGVRSKAKRGSLPQADGELSRVSVLTGGPWATSLGEHLSSFLMPLLEVRYPPLLLLLLLVLQGKVCAEFPGAGFLPAHTSRILRDASQTWCGWEDVTRLIPAPPVTLWPQSPLLNMGGTTPDL